MTVEIVAAVEREHLGPIVALLAAARLPTGDVAHHVEAFLVAQIGGRVVGTVGLEVYGSVALLRSLCVAETHRRRGIADDLLARIEHVARARSVRDLYLLTTTSETFFQRHGYTVVERDHAPFAIEHTAEFQSLCPATATCMHRTIPPATPS